MIKHHAKDGFEVFPASESTLSKALPLGAAGCISATVNMNPEGIHALYEGWNGADGTALQAKADTIRQIFQAVPMIPAMKRVLAEFTGHKEWSRVRPPLTKLNEQISLEVFGQLRSADFSMAG